MRSGIEVRAWIVIIVVALTFQGTAASAQQSVKTRPHDVAVYDGHVVTASLGSEYISILYVGYTEPRTFYVGARSWGVCFADSLAYVTLPDTTYLAVVDLADSAVTTFDEIPVPRGCTEIIVDSDGDAIYVANVGKSMASNYLDQWKHSVLEFDLSQSSAPSTAATTFETERQPRALTLSPDDSRLFVGTAQRALGQQGIWGTSYGEKDTLNGFYGAFDGGSVVMYDTSTGDPTWRIPVGSPVRGLTSLAASDYGGSTGEYRIYFTHVGYGVPGLRAGCRASLRGVEG